MLVNIKASRGGYTLPELVVVFTLIGILSVSMLASFGYYFSIITRNNLMVEMTVASQNLLRAAVEELRYGSGVRQSSNISDPNAPPGGWNTSNSNFIIVVAVPATDSSGNYIINTLTGNPYNNELVYFKNNTTLFKRSLANPAASGNSMRTSCPAAVASASCPADRQLMEHVEDMQFVLYDQDDVSTSNPLDARSVKIILSMSRNTFGDPLNLENSIRVTLRNNFL